MRLPFRSERRRRIATPPYSDLVGSFPHYSILFRQAQASVKIKRNLTVASGARQSGTKGIGNSGQSTRRGRRPRRPADACPPCRRAHLCASKSSSAKSSPCGGSWRKAPEMAKPDSIAPLVRLHPLRRTSVRPDRCARMPVSWLKVEIQPLISKFRHNVYCNQPTAML